MPIQLGQEKDLVSISVSSPITELDFNKYIEQLSSILYKRKHFYLLIDLTQMEEIPYRFILGQGMYMKRMSKWVQKYLGASSIIFKSKVTANLIDLLFTIKKPVRPNLLTRDPTEALNFLAQIKRSNCSYTDNNCNSIDTKDHLHYTLDDVLET